MQKSNELMKRYEFHQESFLCQMPICYFSKPPDEMCSSIDCNISRKLDGVVEYGLHWKFLIHEDHRGKYSKIIDKVLMVIQTIAYEQKFKNPIKLSIYNIAKRLGYKNPRTAYDSIREALDYLQKGFVVTNVYRIRDGAKDSNIQKEKLEQTVTYNLITKIFETNRQVTIKGKTVERKELRWIRIDEDTLAEWGKEGAMRHLPLDAKTMFSLTGREATLYKVIFNEMLRKPKYQFYLEHLRQQLSMTTNDTGKIKKEFRRLMKGLIEKGTGINRYELDDVFLYVYGNLQGTAKSKEAKPLQVEHSEVKELDLIAEVTGKLKLTDNEKRNQNIAKAKECLSKVGFTASQIDTYAERYYKRIPYVCKYIEETDFGFRVNKAGWLRKKLDLKTYEDCIGTWDEDFAYDNGISIDEVIIWIGKIENSASQKLKTGTDKTNLKRTVILDLLYKHRENWSDTDLIKRLASYMYGIDFTKEELRQKVTEKAKQKKLAEVERKKQEQLAEKQRQQEELDKEIEELKNSKQMQREYASNYISAKEGARRANNDPGDKWTKEKTAIEDKFKHAGLDLGAMVKEEKERRVRVNRTAVYDE